MHEKKKQNRQKGLLHISTSTHLMQHRMTSGNCVCAEMWVTGIIFIWTPPSGCSSELQIQPNTHGTENYNNIHRITLQADTCRPWVHISPMILESKFRTFSPVAKIIAADHISSLEPTDLDKTQSMNLGTRLTSKPFQFLKPQIQGIINDKGYKYNYHIPEATVSKYTENLGFLSRSKGLLQCSSSESQVGGQLI